MPQVQAQVPDGLRCEVFLLERAGCFDRHLACQTKSKQIMTERQKKLLEFSGLWEAVWQAVAHEEGWDGNTDPGEHVYRDIEPYGYNSDKIDSVLFFADGTVEFHLKTEEDAYCWDTFPLEVIEDIFNCLE